MTTIKVTEFEGILASVHLSDFDSYDGLSDNYKSLSSNNKDNLAAIADIIAGEQAENVSASGILALEKNRTVKGLKRIAKKLRQAS